MSVKYILLANVGFRNFQNHTYWLLFIFAQIFITMCHLYIHVLTIFYREKSTTGWCVVVMNYFLVLFQLLKGLLRTISIGQYCVVKIVICNRNLFHWCLHQDQSMFFILYTSLLT